MNFILVKISPQLILTILEKKELTIRIDDVDYKVKVKKDRVYLNKKRITNKKQKEQLIFLFNEKKSELIEKHLAKIEKEKAEGEEVENKSKEVIQKMSSLIKENEINSIVKEWSDKLAMASEEQREEAIKAFNEIISEQKIKEKVKR